MREIKRGELYRHFKGNYYYILEIARHSETEEEMVVYKGIYNDQVWVRPLNMFMEKVDKEKYPDIKDEYRFTLIKGDKNHGI